MGTIKSFEDLEIWKRARDICQDIHLIKEETEPKKDFKLYNQLNGSSGSVMDNIADMDNIAEGFEGTEIKKLGNSYPLRKPLVEKPTLNFIEYWIENTLPKKNLTLLSKN